MRDEEGKLLAAREEGMLAGKLEGRQEGKRIGILKGMLAGKIQTLQELLGEPVTGDDALNDLSTQMMQDMIADLQHRLRNRDA